MKTGNSCWWVTPSHSPSHPHTHLHTHTLTLTFTLTSSHPHTQSEALFLYGVMLLVVDMTKRGPPAGHVHIGFRLLKATAHGIGLEGVVLTSFGACNSGPFCPFCKVCRLNDDVILFYSGSHFRKWVGILLYFKACGEEVGRSVYAKQTIHNGLIIVAM